MFSNAFQLTIWNAVLGKQAFSKPTSCVSRKCCSIVLQTFSFTFGLILHTQTTFAMSLNTLKIQNKNAEVETKWETNRMICTWPVFNLDRDYIRWGSPADDFLNTLNQKSILLIWSNCVVNNVFIIHARVIVLRDQAKYIRRFENGALFFKTNRYWAFDDRRPLGVNVFLSTAQKNKTKSNYLKIFKVRRKNRLIGKLHFRSN